LTFTLTPPEFHAALRETPNEKSLWLAMADFLADGGEELAAEALRYAAASGLELHIASTKGEHCFWSNSVLWKNRYERLVEKGISPFNFDQITDVADNTAVSAFNRLLVSWQVASDGYRHQLWSSVKESACT
jgi:uncharacterized protein (TIGR02996 family)